MAWSQAILRSAPRHSVQLGYERGSGAARAKSTSVFRLDKKTPRRAVGRKTGRLICLLEYAGSQKSGTLM